MDPSVVTELMELLSADERARAARMYRAESRQQAIVSRGVLRLILARYLCCPPADIDIEPDPAGKPYIASTDLPLAFNVSHSAERLLVAVACDAEVGVDLERPRQIDDHVSLGRRVLPDQLAQYVTRSTEDEMSGRFAYAWTLFEAHQKLRGTGLDDSPRGWDADACQTHCLSLPEGFSAAVAYFGPRRRLRCYDAAALLRHHPWPARTGGVQ